MKENTCRAIGALIGLIFGILIIVLLGIGVLALEALILWGTGTLAIMLLGIGATITFAQCFGEIILINIIAWIIHKIFFNKD